MRKWILSRSLILALIATTFFFVHAEVETSTFVPERRAVCRGFAPENDEWIPDVNSATAERKAGISRATFNQILDRVTAEYAEEVRRAGGVLRVERRWADGKVNAYAYRDDRHWIVSMYGGMARYPGMNYDGFVSVVCHEVGHHFGGLPKYTGDDWAAVEGEADYYAALKCMRRVFAADDNKRLLETRAIDPHVREACAREHRGQTDQLLCARVGQAGLDMGVVLAKISKEAVPKASTPDRRRVRRTFEDHPRAQCRVDTYLNGAVCDADVRVAMSDEDPYRGACRTRTPGARPRCWFKP